MTIYEKPLYHIHRKDLVLNLRFEIIWCFLQFGTLMDHGFYHTLPAPEQLQRYVRRFVVTEIDEPVDFTAPIPPSGFVYLGWVVRGKGIGFTPFGEIVIPEGSIHASGQIVRAPIEIRSMGAIRHIQAELTPIGLTALTGLKGSDITNRAEILAPSQEIFSPILQRLSEATEPNGDMEELIQRFTNVITDLARSPHNVPGYIASAAQQLEESKGQIKVSDLCEDVSEPQLVRKFTETVGCSPKYFASVIRTNAAVQTMINADGKSLTEIAQQFGYFDQAHFVRSIQTFFGHSPTTLRKQINGVIAQFPAGSALLD